VFCACVPGYRPTMTRAFTQINSDVDTPQFIQPSVTLRPLATPMPVGFLAQAVASFSFAALQLRWIPVNQSHSVAWAVLVLTVPLQALSATLGFWARDPVAGTGTGLLAGGWAAFSVVTLMSPTGVTSSGVGVVLIALGAVLLVPCLAGVTKVAAALVLLLSAARFASTGIQQATASSGWQSTAGWVGVALSAVSTYAALAFELEAVSPRTVLPVGRFGAARRAGQPGEEGQLRELRVEPGVRRLL
jgi:succinate-acetate transporter protein